MHRKRDDLLAVVAAGETIVRDTVHDVAEIPKQHGRAVAIGDDQLAIGLGIHQLPVGLHGQVLVNTVERAYRQIGVAALQGRRYVVDADAAAGQCRRIELRAHGVFLFAGHQHLGHAADRRKPLRQRSVRVLIHF